MQIHTLPMSRGERDVIARVRMLTDFEWTPIRDIPAYVLGKGHCIIPAGKTVTGFPYSSTEETDKFIGANVSFETFLSAIPNPESKLYQVGHGGKGRCNYGMVCNGFVRCVLGIPYRVNTQCWYQLDGMTKIAEKESYKVEDFRLCDILHAYNDGRNHVALITDIIKDEQGEIQGIEVSEGVAPLCKRETYTPEVYYEKYRPFGLWRYEYLEEVPAFDENDAKVLQSGLDKVIPKITVDGGNRCNYTEGEEIIVSVFEKQPDVVEIVCGDKVVQEYHTSGRCFFPCKLSRGYYEARLKNSSEKVLFCVTKPEITHEVNEDTITIHADARDEQSKLLYLDFRLPGSTVSGIVNFEVLTEEEKLTGEIVRKIPRGAENYKIHFENPYGIWSHRMIKI